MDRQFHFPVVCSVFSLALQDATRTLRDQRKMLEKSEKARRFALRAQALDVRQTYTTFPSSVEKTIQASDGLLFASLME